MLCLSLNTETIVCFTVKKMKCSSIFELGLDSKDCIIEIIVFTLKALTLNSTQHATVHVVVTTPREPYTMTRH